MLAASTHPRFTTQVSSLIFSPAILDLPDLLFCAVDSVVHGASGRFPRLPARSSFPLLAGRVATGVRIAHCRALLSERALERVAQLPVLGFQGTDPGSCCFQAAQQRGGCRTLPVGDRR
jgi:hypothetical protein